MLVPGVTRGTGDIEAAENSFVEASLRVETVEPRTFSADSGHNGLDVPRDDGDAISTCSSTTCSTGSEVPDGVRAVLGAAVDAAASMAPAMTIGGIRVQNSTCQVGNNMHVHGPLTLVVSPGAIAGPSAPGMGLTAGNLGLLQDAKHLDSLGQPAASQPEAPPDRSKRASPLLRWQPCAAVVAVVAALAVGVAILAALLLGSSASAPPDAATTGAPMTTSPTAPPSPIPMPHGVQYVPRALWRARPAKTKSPPRLSTPVDTVIVHHSGTAPCSSLPSCSDRVLAMQRYNMVDRGWDDIGYNFLVGGDGRVYEGRGWDVVGAFLSGWNARALGVAVIGTFTEVLPPDRQRQQLASFLQLGVDLGKITPQYRLVGACQLQSTSSPGLLFMQDLRTWKHWWDVGVEKCYE